jgi:hypothetical protein
MADFEICSQLLSSIRITSSGLLAERNTAHLSANSRLYQPCPLREML